MSMIDEIRGLDVKIEERYPFKRDAYYDLQDIIDKSDLAVTCFTGPRRCGKSVVFMQLKEFYGDRAVLLDCKHKSMDDIMGVFHELRQPDNKKIYLIDEATYIEFYDSVIGELDLERLSSKVIITGSQSAALRRTVSLNFASAANYVSIGFLTFNEYLRYIGKVSGGEYKYSQIFGNLENLPECNFSEDDYYNFVYSKYAFTKPVMECREYLRGCLDETVISCNTSLQGTCAHELKDINVKTVITVMYALLFKLHSNVGSSSLVTDSLFKKTKHDYKYERGERLPSQLYEEAVSKVLEQYYKTARNLSAEELRLCIKFLHECDLLVFTVHYPDIDNEVYFTRWMSGSVRPNFDEALCHFGITFKYPMFVAACLFDLERELRAKGVEVNEGELLSRSLLGSATECEVKRYMSEIKQTDLVYDLQISENGAIVSEIDYYDPIQQLAVEVSIRNKTYAETHFDSFDIKACRRILLSNDKLDCVNGDVQRVPYYLFLAMISGR